MTVVNAKVPSHLSSARPWGRFDQFATNECVTVKLIAVEPHQRLSLQRHGLRSELWIVIDGPVDVEISGECAQLTTGERAWIPALALHRLGNPTAHVVRVLEVAFGFFDEADIERVEDDHARPEGLEPPTDWVETSCSIR